MFLYFLRHHAPVKGESTRPILRYKGADWQKSQFEPIASYHAGQLVAFLSEQIEIYLVFCDNAYPKKPLGKICSGFLIDPQLLSTGLIPYFISQKATNGSLPHILTPNTRVAQWYLRSPNANCAESGPSSQRKRLVTGRVKPYASGFVYSDFHKSLRSLREPVSSSAFSYSLTSTPKNAWAQPSS